MFERFLDTSSIASACILHAYSFPQIVQLFLSSYTILIELSVSSGCPTVAAISFSLYLSCQLYCSFDFSKWH